MTSAESLSRGLVNLTLENLRRPGRRCTNSFIPPSWYSNTSYSTARPSHLVQLPRLWPSTWTVNRGVRAGSGMARRAPPSPEVRHQAGALAVHEQLGPDPGPEAVVQLTREVVQLVVRPASRLRAGRHRGLSGGGPPPR